MPVIDQLFQLMKKSGATGLHLSAGLEPRLRKQGHLVSIPSWPTLDEIAIREILHEIVSDEGWNELETKMHTDFVYALDGVGRLRAHYFIHENGTAAVFRIIDEKILPLEALSLPAAIDGLVQLEHGFVVIAAPRGAGRTTLVSSLIDKINVTQAKHIVAIETPAEVVHTNRKSTITHREVGVHVESVAAGIRWAMRQDASIVAVGELTDAEATRQALDAAEAGLLVVTTACAAHAASVIQRLVHLFPIPDQAAIRRLLGDTLAGIFCQVLIRTVDGQDRVAAHEVLLRNSALACAIYEGNMDAIGVILQSGRKEGMQSLDDALAALVKTGKISADDARSRAVDRRRFEPAPREAPKPAQREAPSAREATKVGPAEMPELRVPPPVSKPMPIAAAPSFGEEAVLPGLEEQDGPPLELAVERSALKH
jgi:twitching motility protein PilT